MTIRLTLIVAILLFSKAANSQNAYAILVGLKTIDHSAYRSGYSDAATVGAPADIQHMKTILIENGFAESNITIIQDANATRDNVANTLTTRVSQLAPNDLLVFYFTGHGDNVPDTSKDESDFKDEVLVCYDKYLLDDDLYAIWKKSDRTKRLIMVADACRAGSTYKIFMDHKVGSSGWGGSRNDKFNSEVLFEANFMRKNNFETNGSTEEPFQMIYVGASTDATDAVGGSASGSKFTTALFDVYNSLDQSRLWPTTTFKEFIEDVSATTQYSQIVTYVEISCTPAFISPYPFKIK